jgi:hypothetical protein
MPESAHRTTQLTIARHRSFVQALRNFLSMLLGFALGAVNNLVVSPSAFADVMARQSRRARQSKRDSKLRRALVQLDAAPAESEAS